MWVGGCRWWLGVGPVIVGRKSGDQCVCEMPHVVVLVCVLCDGGGQCDVKIWPIRVLNNGSGVWAISVGNENVSRRG